MFAPTFPPPATIGVHQLELATGVGLDERTISESVAIAVFVGHTVCRPRFS